jgi:hypothetical protein
LTIEKDVENILFDNLKEALKQFQNYLVWGIVACLTYFLLTIGNSTTTSLNITPIGSLPPIDISTGKFISLSVYWILGLLSGFTLERAERISLTLIDINPRRLKAMLTYPSIATGSHLAVRLFASLIPILIAVSGAIVDWNNDLKASIQIGMILLLIAPYLTIIIFQLQSKMPLVKQEKIKIER